MAGPLLRLHCSFGWETSQETPECFPRPKIRNAEMGSREEAETDDRTRNQHCDRSARRYGDPFMVLVQSLSSAEDRMARFDAQRGRVHYEAIRTPEAPERTGP